MCRFELQFPESLAAEVIETPDWQRAAELRKVEQTKPQIEVLWKNWLFYRNCRLANLPFLLKAPDKKEAEKLSVAKITEIKMNFRYRLSKQSSRFELYFSLSKQKWTLMYV